MTARRARLIVLCEDSQHEAFIRRFLKGMGWGNRDMRVIKSPSGRGSAEQWVRENFPSELAAFRNRSHRASTALLLMQDEDGQGVQHRIDTLRKVCEEQMIPFPTDEERVAIVFPSRNIETWIHYLMGTDVDEQSEYSKLQRPRDCRDAVEELLKLCKNEGLAESAPSSLFRACGEYRKLQ
jgi:hypothetical protein